MNLNVFTSAQAQSVLMLCVFGGLLGLCAKPMFYPFYAHLFAQ